MDEHDVDPFLTPVHLRRELLATGSHDRDIAKQVADGVLVRPRRGGYAGARDWRALDVSGRHVVRTRAVLKAACTPLVVSHASAVPWHGGPVHGLDLESVHVTRQDGKVGRKEAGVHQHCGHIVDGDVVELHGVKVMSPARTAIEVTTTATLESGLVVMNDFLQRKLVTPADLRARYEQGMEHWPDSRVTDIVIRLADPRIESVLETLFCALCYRASIPKPTPQYEVRDPSTGRIVARLDFAWPKLGAYVEADGHAKYEKYRRPGETAGDAVFREKRREDLVREITSFRGMRVTWADVHSPVETERRLRRLLYPA